MARVLSGCGVGSSETESEGVEEIGKDDGWEGVVEVSQWLVRLAKGAVCYDVRAVGEVEQSCIERCDFRFQNRIFFSERTRTPVRCKTCEKNIIRCLKARGGRSEDVVGREVWECRKEGEHGGDKENVERSVDRNGDWLPRSRSCDSFCPLGTVPAYEAGNEERAEGEEKSLEAARRSGFILSRRY